jgi:NADH-quinone oxidoreductase subunit H
MHYSLNLLLTIIFIVVILNGVLVTVAYLVLAERKVSAWMQDRIGPNRVGWRGSLQSFADVLKLMFKEQIIPTQVDKLFYCLAPAVAVGTALLALAVVPVGATTAPPSVAWPQTNVEAMASEESRKYDLEQYEQQIQFVIAPRVDIGVLFVFAIGGLAVYGIILGGWSSNNKYSFLGALRSSAQLISYEIPLGMSAMAVILLASSLNVERIIDRQLADGWYILYQPLAFLLFLTSVFAECNRLPFDLPEAEQELVGGYHTEYSGMKFGLYFLGEYVHMITTSFLVAALFLGGWHLPGLADAGPIVKLLILCGKMLLIVLFSMFIRWTIPRFRFDQLMGLAWRVLMPLALLNLVCVMVVKHLAGGALGWRQMVVLCLASVALLVGAAAMNVRRAGRPVASAPG